MSFLSHLLFTQSHGDSTQLPSKISVHEEKLVKAKPLDCPTLHRFDAAWPFFSPSQMPLETFYQILSQLEVVIIERAVSGFPFHMKDTDNSHLVVCSIIAAYSGTEQTS